MKNKIDNFLLITGFNMDYIQAGIKMMKYKDVNEKTSDNTPDKFGNLIHDM